MQHYSILIANETNTKSFIDSILNTNDFSEFAALNELRGDVLSKHRIEELIYEEEHHDLKIATSSITQSLKSMSTGERKKIVLEYLISTKPDYLILDNPFDNLDQEAIQSLSTTLKNLSKELILIVLLSRKNDAPNFISNTYKLDKSGSLEKINLNSNLVTEKQFSIKIPEPILKIDACEDPLIYLKNVSVNYHDKPILTNINWKINKGEFWQLKGANGSGKTTVLSMITGENSKGYGQDLYLFNQKKGSGESIWDIKKKIGYYAPTLTHNFYGEHTLEHMLISGLNDSIGLYKLPTEQQINAARAWLVVLDLYSKKDTLFIDLPVGQQRLIMVARAMIKQPLLLILDEPTENLDDASASLFVALINKISQETSTAIIFVSHRNEVGLQPKNIFELQKTKNGSIGVITK